MCLVMYHSVQKKQFVEGVLLSLDTTEGFVFAGTAAGLFVREEGRPWQRLDGSLRSGDVARDCAIA